MGLGGDIQKEEDVGSTMLAKGLILGKDAVNKSNIFNEKLHLTLTPPLSGSKIRLSEKIKMGTTPVNVKMKEVDKKFQVFDKTKLAFAAVEQTVSSGVSAIMKNIYILTDTSWVIGALSRVTKAVAEVRRKMEKMDEEEQTRSSNFISISTTH